MPHQPPVALLDPLNDLQTDGRLWRPRALLHVIKLLRYTPSSGGHDKRAGTICNHHYSVELEEDVGFETSVPPLLSKPDPIRYSK